MSEELKARLHDALSEVMVIKELEPALAILSEATGSSRAGFYRFPRYSVGALGEAMIAAAGDEIAGVWRDELVPLVPKVITLDTAPKELLALAAKELLVVAFEPAPFGERGAVGMAFAREKKRYGKDETAILTACQQELVSAHKRIRRFESVTGQYAGLATLIEKRLGACAALATAKGEVVWMSQNARALLGDEGRERLEERLAGALKEAAKDAGSKGAREFTLMPDGKSRVFGAMSFVRESPETSVHYIAVELFGSDVESHKDEAKLTRTEREVYVLLKQGKSNDEIAKARFVSVETVRSHVKSVFAKLGVSSRVELLTKKPSE
ncbi:MAG: hypothetical protein IT381_06310 [Deltaproteobacteria bacterium]|nr:hypothetical protein [Deltaproteobacteria bacterium]